MTKIYVVVLALAWIPRLAGADTPCRDRCFARERAVWKAYCAEHPDVPRPPGEKVVTCVAISQQQDFNDSRACYQACVVAPPPTRPIVEVDEPTLTPAEQKLRDAELRRREALEKRLAAKRRQDLLDNFKHGTSVTPVPNDPDLAALNQACLDGNATACADAKARRGAKVLRQDHVMPPSPGDSCNRDIRACDQNAATCKRACGDPMACVMACRAAPCHEASAFSLTCAKQIKTCDAKCEKDSTSCVSTCPSCREVRACLTKTSID